MIVYIYSTHHQFPPALAGGHASHINKYIGFSRNSFSRLNAKSASKL